MAKIVLPDGKKRYTITLTEDNYKWFHHFITKVCKQHRSVVSVTIDEMIGEMREAVEPMLKQYHESGKEPSWADFLVFLGKQIQRVGDDQLSLK